jgi:chromosome partitioning protein
MSQAVVIAVANAKGGCCKTTTVIILAGEYAAQGYRVRIIDADPRKRALKWAAAGVKPENITVTEAAANNMRAEIENASKESDVVLIDVEGTANAALTMAVAFANSVIIPAQMSPPDVEDGLATIQLVQDMAHAARREIPYGLLWSNVQPAIRSREMMNLESQVSEAKVPVIGRVYHRSAFAALFSFSTTLDELPPKEVPGIDKAKADAIRLADAMADLMRGNATSDSTSEAAA